MGEKVEVIWTDPSNSLSLASSCRNGLWRFGMVVEGEDRGEQADVYTQHMLHALCKWWIGKHPSLLTELLSEEQKEALRWAVDMASAYSDNLEENLRSILTPKEA